MANESIRIIREEHAALASMFRSLGLMVERGPVDDVEGFFDVMRAMLFYVDEFPTRLHHPKESELLFPRVARLAPETVDLIARLERDHANGESEVRELQHLLLAWELVGSVRRPAFTAAARQYLEGALSAGSAWIGGVLVRHRPPLSPFFHKEKHVAAAHVNGLAMHVEGHVKVVRHHRGVTIDMDDRIKLLPVVNAGGRGKALPACHAGGTAVDTLALGRGDGDHVGVEIPV